MPVLATRGISALLACSGCVSLFAEVVTLNPVADTCLFEFDPDFNFGRQRDLPGGTLGLMGNSSRCRVLYKFDLAAVPAGATIESARLTLAITSQLPVGRQVSDFALSRVLVDWGEGDGFGERPGGREALPAEATWNHRFHPGEGQTAIPWAEPGGEFGVDFASARSGMAENVDGSRSNPTSYVFEFNPTGLADLQGMIDGAVPNHGWVLYTLSETTRKTARRWTSREAINEGPKPKLEITYSQPPAPPEITAIEIDRTARELNVRLNGLAGFSYQLESGDNLTSWESGEVQVPTEDSELVFRVPIEAPRKFVRVGVTEP